MPNTDPVVDRAPVLRALQERAEHEAVVPVGFLAAITKGQAGMELTEMVELAREGAAGFSDDRITAILEAVPVATHNQRGTGTLQLGLPEACDADVDAADLLAIVEDSMSSEIYELMKRSDEAAVVEKAARRPRFVEDCVHEAIRGTIERFGELGDDVFVSARQESFETIHQHNVVAERSGLIGELRREDPAHRTTMREWLSAA